MFLKQFVTGAIIIFIIQIIDINSYSVFAQDIIPPAGVVSKVILLSQGIIRQGQIFSPPVVVSKVILLSQGIIRQGQIFQPPGGGEQSNTAQSGNNTTGTNIPAPRWW